MRNLTCLLVVTSLTTLAACADSTSPPAAGAAVERFELESDEVFYVRDASGVVALDATRPFQHVEFHVSLGEAEFRVLGSDGEAQSAWLKVDAFTEDTAPAAHEGVLALDQPAMRLEFRSDEPIAFARFLVGEGSGHFHEGEVPVPEGAMVSLSAQAGRWIPPDDVLVIANQQYLPYSGAPSRCAGTFLSGTREVADFLKREFEGATSYGGYACRANTANTSQLSVHASGRAIDLFVPLDGGEADNDLGDPIAHYLIANAQQLGIEFIVWDRTSWGAHREAPKHRAYTGPHPHHDHLHIELSPTSANTTGRAFPPILRDTPPVGYLDVVDCDGIRGWAQDPDAPDQAIPVYISIGGPVFAPEAVGYTISANRHREDLCTAIGSCEHGYDLPIPRGLMDGVAREVHVYGMDVTGPTNSALGAAPKTLQCNTPELPYGPDFGVLRHVPNPETFERWNFDWNDIAIIDDALLSALPRSAPLPDAPMLQRAAGDPAVYLVESEVRRHVPNGDTMTRWAFDWAAIVEAPVDDLVRGADVASRPFLARGSGLEVFLVEPPPPLWADQIAWNAPPRLGRGQTATVALELRNRGAATWEVELFELRPSSVRLEVPIAPTEVIRLPIEITAPDELGVHMQCVEPMLDGFAFPQEPICVTFEVVDEEVVLDATEFPNVDAEENDDWPRVIDARGGCSSVDGESDGWSLIWALGLVFGARRARRTPRRGVRCVH